MILIIGLGNSGKKYIFTRHNIGFRTIDNLQLTINNFSDWKNNKKFISEISKGEISGQKVILAKPQTFMNLSGRVVKKIINNYQLTINNIFVVHDDLDLPLGKIRISVGRGSAGHKGVESIIKELKTRNFVRFRIGINRFAQNQKPKTKNQKLDEFVLEKFTKKEEEMLKDIIKKTVEAIEFSLREGIEKAMTKFN